MRTSQFLALGLALCSVRGASQGGRPAAPVAGQWVVMRDTEENAFSIEVPRGWRVSGGAYRLGANNPRFLVDMTSSDGRTNLRVRDSAVTAFSLPRPGSSEGQRYSTGVDWGIFARYLPGKDFAVAYAEGRFHGACQNIQLKIANTLPPVLAPERQVIAST